MSQKTRPNRHRNGQNRGHGYRDGRDHQNQGEFQGGQHGVTPEKGHTQDQDHQHQRQHDQIIADFDDSLLKMTGLLRTLNQVGGFAKVGFFSGGDDHAINLSLLNDRTGVDRFTRRVHHR